VSSVPDYAEPVQGWRAWSLVRCDGRAMLRSLYTNVVWDSGQALSASCQRSRRRFFRPWHRYLPSHPAPRMSCTCGVYAAFEPEPIVPLLIPPANPPMGELGRAIGKVALWGEVVECARGWRASLAYPQHLYLWSPAVGSRRRDEIRAVLDEELSEYGVPVEWIEATARHELLGAIAAG